MEKKTISNRVLRYVLSMSDEAFADLSVSKLAHFLDVDRFKLLRNFKDQMNMTLEFFLYREKMTRAAILLTTNNGITVKQVAEKLGFCTCDYFIKKFKEYYGTMPGRYKEFKIPPPGMADQEKQDGNSPRTSDQRQMAAVKQQHVQSQKQQKGQVPENKKNPCEICHFRLAVINSGKLKN